MHYLSLLVLPLALAQPRFGVIWTLPLLLVLTPADHPPDPVRLLLLAVMAVVVADALGALRRERGARARRGAGDACVASHLPESSNTGLKAASVAVSVSAALPRLTSTTRICE